MFTINCMLEEFTRIYNMYLFVVEIHIEGKSI